MHRLHTEYKRRIRAVALLFAAACLAMSGCAQLGPNLVKAGRNDYNKILGQTEEEETLLNLVRLRYVDNPVMLDVSSVSSQSSTSEISSGLSSFRPFLSTGRINTIELFPPLNGISNTWNPPNSVREADACVYIMGVSTASPPAR